MCRSFVAHAAARATSATPVTGRQLEQVARLEYVGPRAGKTGQPGRHANEKAISRQNDLQHWLYSEHRAARALVAPRRFQPLPTAKHHALSIPSPLATSPQPVPGRLLWSHRAGAGPLSRIVTESLVSRAVAVKYGPSGRARRKQDGAQLLAKANRTEHGHRMNIFAHCFHQQLINLVNLDTPLSACSSISGGQPCTRTSFARLPGKRAREECQYKKS